LTNSNLLKKIKHNLDRKISNYIYLEWIYGNNKWNSDSFHNSNKNNNHEVLKNNYIKEFIETTIMENIKFKTGKTLKACEDYLKKHEIIEDYINKAKNFVLIKKMRIIRINYKKKLILIQLYFIWKV